MVSPLTSTSQREGRTVVALSYHEVIEVEQEVHDRSNKEQPGPGVRQTAVAI